MSFKAVCERIFKQTCSNDASSRGGLGAAHYNYPLGVFPFLRCASHAVYLHYPKEDNDHTNALGK